MGLFTYILRCSDDSFYVGVTNNIDVRLQQHNSCINPSCYTAKRVPVVLTWCKFFESNMEAIFFEKQLKGWTRKKKEALINRDFDLLHELAKCRNESNSYNYNPDTSTKLSGTGNSNEECTSTLLNVTSGLD